MRALIIGYGSIGKRHDEVLSKFDQFDSIDIVSKQKLEDKTTYLSLDSIENLDDYDYFVIASATNKHFEQLKYLEANLSNKIILCEKPLFETKKELAIEKNKVFIGYVLRFHPLLQKLQSFLLKETVINVNVNCGQYLPTWRENTDYRDSYSAKELEGGGVLLDLSHEIDYSQWLFGNLVDIKSYKVKISDLEIDSDDLTTLIGKTENGTVINISIDYISKITHRKILIHTFEHSYELDFILNKLVKKNKNGFEELFSFSNLEKNNMFKAMHKAALNNDLTNICTYGEGLNVMETISKVQGQNK